MNMISYLLTIAYSLVYMLAYYKIISCFSNNLRRFKTPIHIFQNDKTDHNHLLPQDIFPNLPYQQLLFLFSFFFGGGVWARKKQ